MGKRLRLYRRVEIWSTERRGTKYFPSCEGVSLALLEGSMPKTFTETSLGSLTSEALSIPVVWRITLEMS